MTACPRCGFGNPPDAAACQNPECRADLALDTAGAPADAHTGRVPAGGTAPAMAPPDTGAYRTVPPQAPPYRRPPPTAPLPSYSDPDPDLGGVPSGGADPHGVPSGGAEQHAGMRLTAEPLDLTVEPGGAPASLTLKVRNRGTQVDHFMLAVNGPVAAYARIEPPVLQVFPDDEHEAQVFFAVPRASEPVAGRAPFQIVARARVHPGTAERVAGTLTINRFDQITAALAPEMTRGRRPGLHQLTVVNQGNAPLRIDVALSDQQGELAFDPPRLRDRLDAGSRVTRQVQVGAPVKWFGRTQLHNFTGAVTTDAPAATASVQGRRRQIPRFPWWIPTALVATIALVIGIIAILPKPKVPGVVGTPRLAAEKTLTDAGYRPVVTEQPDEAIPPDAAIKTDPAQGTPLKRKQSVQLFVSTGPCRGQCQVAVPDVHLLPTAQATQYLTSAQFVIDRVATISDPVVPADAVISTNPAAGTKADIGSKVVITASSGPAVAPSSAAPPAGASSAPPAAPPPPTAVPIPPALVGGTAAAAAAALTKLGLTVTKVPVRSNQAPLDSVLSITPPNPPPGSTVTMQTAVPTAPIDLLNAAASATWSDNSGALTFGPPLPAVGPPPLVPPPPRAVVAPFGPTDLFEDGSPGPALGTEPPLSATLPPPQVTGEFTLTQPVIAGDHLRADVGLRDPTAVNGDVDVIVRIPGKDPLFTERKFRTGKLLAVDVDLTPAVGATAVQIEIDARGTTPASNGVGWKNLRIEGQVG